LEFLSEYGLFLAKAVTFVLAIFAIVSLIASLAMRNKKQDRGQFEVTRVNEKYEHTRDMLRDAMLDEEGLKLQQKAEKKKLKAEKAEKKKAAKLAGKKSDSTASENKTETPQDESVQSKKRVFVLDFYGDIKASECDLLREEITAVLSQATEKDEVVVKVESGGGMVHSYGLAASQLARITQKNIPLTVCVDKVAASGGYMMACVANKIVAAPFAILGSIGVVASLPNFHKLLKKNDIDYEMFTAGEYKRTVTMFGENTEKGRAKFVEDLEDTHVLFKEFVSEHRPQINIEEIATGEIWFGRRAKDVNLIDEIKTSDEYLLSQIDTADIFQVEYIFKKSIQEKLGLAAQGAVDRLLMTWWERLHFNRWF
jgi:serine protease SohB